MKKYSGQAIAIIMVVLVVAAVIGASLYSRMIRNKGEVVDTRESQMALELSGNVLDAFITSDIPLLQGHLAGELKGADLNRIDLINYGEIESFLTPVNAVSLDEVTQNYTSCSEPTVSITYAGEQDGIVYGVGQVMAIHIEPDNPPPGECVATLNVSGASGGSQLFTVKIVYMNPISKDVEPYELNDMLLYCINQPCTDIVSPEASIADNFDNTGTLSYDFDSLTNIYEIRVLPLKGDIKIAVDGNEYCGDYLNNYLVTASATCTNQERTMEVVIPNAVNIGYPALFDYTIYNANGTLTPFNQ